MDADKFIALIAPGAMLCHKNHGIPASFTIAQAALESGWGASKLAIRGNNLFGVKADRSWRGPHIDMDTGEYLGGKWVKIPARWRAYATWAECVLDRAGFFRDNPRYSKCWGEKTGKGWARAVAAAGYATDPDYAAKLVATITARKLEVYDVKH